MIPSAVNVISKGNSLALMLKARDLYDKHESVKIKQLELLTVWSEVFPEVKVNFVISPL